MSPNNENVTTPTPRSATFHDLPRVADLLTPDQVAEGLGVSTKTLTNWRSRSVGPAYVRVAGRVFYTLGAYTEYWLEQTGGAA